MSYDSEEAKASSSHKAKLYDVPLRVAVGGNVDSGKCFAINTKVLMFDGKIKLIQNIKLEEKVMGDDSQPRTVVGTTTGKDLMYNVKMKRGGEYNVNSHHILCLKRTNIESIYIDHSRKAYWCKWWENLKVKNKRFYWNNDKEKAKEKTTAYLKIEVPKLPHYTPSGQYNIWKLNCIL